MRRLASYHVSYRLVSFHQRPGFSRRDSHVWTLARWPLWWGFRVLRWKRALQIQAESLKTGGSAELSGSSPQHRSFWQRQAGLGSWRVSFTIHSRSHLSIPVRMSYTESEKGAFKTLQKRQNTCLSVGHCFDSAAGWPSKGSSGTNACWLCHFRLGLKNFIQTLKQKQCQTIASPQNSISKKIRSGKKQLWVSDNIQNSVYYVCNAFINSPLYNCTLNYNKVITVNVKLQPSDNWTKMSTL